MQSPEYVESNKNRHSSCNSKLHTPCRQIGLRRKRSRTSDTPIKENKSPKVKTETSDTPIKESKSPEVKTDATVEENEHIPTTPKLVNISDQAISVDKNETKENCRLQKAKEDNKLTPAVFINSGNSQDVKKEVEAVKKRIKEKEEKIAALRLAKVYKKKHDTNTLSELTERWREGCQTALQELLSSSAAHGYQVNMTQLISQLGIPFHLIRYNPDLEDFE